MNWKVFLTASISSLLLTLPQNSFTCGGSEDPYDYYTSFFSNKVEGTTVYKPFYYTALLNFYDDWAPDSLGYNNDRVIQEWMAYLKAPQESVVKLVYLSTKDDLLQLQKTLSGEAPVPSIFQHNIAAKKLLTDKKEAAISYLAFAKQIERKSDADLWADQQKDSLLLNRYIDEAKSNFTRSTDPFLQNKWAFIQCKLAFYNNQFPDCIRLYDAYFTDDNKSAVKQLALSYKAGSLFRMGKKKEAAYAFCKAFPLSDQNKKENFLGFLWATDYCNQALLEDYLGQCKSPEEKATMLGLFSLYGTENRLNNMQKIYESDPRSPLLPLLARREINKLEEQYFTPLLTKEKGGKSLNNSWTWRYEDENGNPRQLSPEPVIKTAKFFEKLMLAEPAQERNLYRVGAAYLHLMSKNYAKAKTLLAGADKTTFSAQLKDQSALIDLLIVANEEKVLTPLIESRILASVKWLTQKAKKEGEYAIFCRNFFSEILAQKYEQQGEPYKAAMAYGMADLKFINQVDREAYYFYPFAIDYVRNEMSTPDLLKLYEITTAPQTETLKFFVENSSVKRDDVIDVIGTSYLRDANYPKAVEWLTKASKLDPLIETQYNYQTNLETKLNADPLYDYINDWQRFNKPAAKPYTKLTLAQKLLELQTKANSTKVKEDKSKTYYQLATALYNLSYYGNCWNAVAYYRSSSDWNEGVYKLPWEKEYYGVYRAKSYYQKAYETATNKEFKAACLFMVAKCLQRQIPRPAYVYNDYDLWDKKMNEFEQVFRKNPLFGKFKKEFGTTKFYQYTYNRCSYLRDFLKAEKK